MNFETSTNNPSQFDLDCFIKKNKNETLFHFGHKAVKFLLELKTIWIEKNTFSFFICQLNEFDQNIKVKIFYSNKFDFVKIQILEENEKSHLEQ